MNSDQSDKDSHVPKDKDVEKENNSQGNSVPIDIPGSSGARNINFVPVGSPMNMFPPILTG